MRFRLLGLLHYKLNEFNNNVIKDLTAIGISKPSVRKRLKTEIGKLSIKDGIPDFKPVSSNYQFPF